MTNAEKFKEVFGFDDGIADANYESYMCREKKECVECGYFGNLLHCAHFWNSEYSGTPTIPLKGLISREEALMALTGVNLPTDRDKLIALFDKRIKALPPVEAVPLSVIEKIHDAIDKADADGDIEDDHGCYIGSVFTDQHIHEIIDKAVSEVTHEED